MKEHQRESDTLFLGLKTGTVSTMVFYWFCDGMRVVKGFNLSSIIAGGLEEQGNSIARFQHSKEVENIELYVKSSMDFLVSWCRN
jgi:lipoprotein signal peptidase